MSQTKKRSGEEAQLDASPVEPKKRFVRGTDAVTLLAHVSLVDLPVARGEVSIPEALFDLIMEYAEKTSLRRLANQEEPQLYDADNQPTRDYLDALGQIFLTTSRGPNGATNIERTPWPHRVLTRSNFPATTVADDLWKNTVLPHCLPEAHGARVHLDLHGFIEYVRTRDTHTFARDGNYKIRHCWLKTHADRHEPESK
jgi:hypothetical protein